MVNQSTYLFANNFVRALEYLGITEIPIYGEKYWNAMDSIKKILKENKGKLSKFEEIINDDSLHLKNSLESAIISLSGTRIHLFPSPRGTVLSFPRSKNKFTIPEKSYIRLAKLFCKKAIPYKRLS